MSSTNRGGQRTEADNYPTPIWCTKRCIVDGPDLPGGVWYEPCAGDGAIVRAVNQWRGPKADPISWQLNELREEACTQIRDQWPFYELRCGDLFDPVPSEWDEPSVVITNPPFSIAWESIHHLLSTFPDSHLVLLLRLNFLGSETRQSFMSSYAPDVYVLPNRPSFIGEGKTDSIEYAWFHWHPVPRAREMGHLKVLPNTSHEERMAG